MKNILVNNGEVVVRGNFKLAKRHVVDEGVIVDGQDKYRYVIYTTKLHQMRQYRINTWFYEDHGIYHCDGAYDGFLCETAEEYKNFTENDLQDAVYRAYMGGAR